MNQILRLPGRDVVIVSSDGGLYGYYWKNVDVRGLPLQVVAAGKVHQDFARSGYPYLLTGLRRKLCRELRRQTCWLGKGTYQSDSAHHGVAQHFGVHIGVSHYYTALT